MTEHLHLARRARRLRLAPGGVAAHTDAEPVTSGRYWSDLAATAERGLLDFVTFDDALTPQRRRRAEIEPRWLAGTTRRRAGRVAGGAGDPPHRADPGRHRHPHRAVPRLQSHCHA